ncbi:glycosyl-4,4'-diaponeurosporenoate acyltransferase [Virgibacillus flavescens]|uniref:glycosyl-4,4'-diaponeurosporenoate acyltransferase CrtO family protein n=1 Tax=Virgibacillus flavescens TaxID=1611422 RepID=UPI003D34D712
MQLVELPIIWTILIDIFAWGFFHIGISLLTLNMSADRFTSDRLLYKSRNWERDGQVWQRYFHVKKWKNMIPDGTNIIKQGFAKDHLSGSDARYLWNFLVESRRAELTHWLSILPAGLFFLWNPAWAGWLMIGYAILFNGPIIMVQRYNRPRLQKIIVSKMKD